jgi:hypothetical protein
MRRLIRKHCPAAGVAVHDVQLDATPLDCLQRFNIRVPAEQRKQAATSSTCLNASQFGFQISIVYTVKQQKQAPVDIASRLQLVFDHMQQLISSC